MKRYSGHKEPWGEFVDVKINAPEVLSKQLQRARRGTVWISSVCDPYQPLEAKYGLTRRCLKELLEKQFPVNIQTKSKLVLRDLDLLKNFKEIEVGFTITTNDEKIAKLFEPGASSIAERVKALEKLRASGIRTFAFIGPLLPGDPEKLVADLAGLVNRVFIDRMNYLSKTRALFEELDLSRWLDRSFTQGIIERLRRVFDGKAEAVC
jgi:DNA repair photolyase